ncbi:hypothetical protein EDF52_113127 [Curtobacterium sp. PhB42]|uniref:hypothetical protein n=1 Tax=unclassified Curtobacterium TaxID=257496 RepID=UPI001047AEA3|nr:MULTISPECIES: hypothetical protein [unclassified Curtobacterium]TCU82299.1 hypothetical protein EDF48_11251 [Curtobacterium sp. PhB191]TDW43173.1 hypothetical protein EDF52_113127 [Curtobacterium sp. PhB42]TDW53530.1 hypothetical protein EDF47_10942 [Curtobacterium sp. PhB190]
MTDDTSTPEPIDEGAAAEQQPESLEDKVRRLEQLVAGILLADAGAAADDEPEVPHIGAAPVAETSVADTGGPWNWVGVDTERRTGLAEELTAFVHWLEERYLRHLSSEEYQFPANWYENPVVVEVLTAVMVARQAAYSDMLADPSSALSEWHERALWPALERLQSLNVFHDNGLVPRNRPAVTADDAAAQLGKAAEVSVRALSTGAADPRTGEVPTGPADPATETINVVA